MEIKKLRKLVEKQEELGLDQMILKMPAPKSWKNGCLYPERVKTPFGLTRWVANNLTTESDPTP